MGKLLQRAPAPADKRAKAHEIEMKQRSSSRSHSGSNFDSNNRNHNSNHSRHNSSSNNHNHSRSPNPNSRRTHGGGDNSRNSILPTHRVNSTGHHINHNGHRVTTGIQPEGESGRKGIHPLEFIRICFRSSNRASCAANFLWPVVPAAIAVKYARPKWHLTIFILNYIAMVPCANLIGFGGEELARKMHKVTGVLVETTLGSVVEIVLFIVLLTENEFQVIQAAILGSILATQLLCLGLCFAVGGARHSTQEFDEVMGEVGSDLLLTAGFGLIIPSAFQYAVNALPDPPEDLAERVLKVGRATSILLIVSYIVYVYFQIRTHEGIYDAIFEADNAKDKDRHKELVKDKLTLTECAIALAFSIALVTIIAINLVKEIHYVVEQRGISDAFLGLILVPLVEKFAEHLTAIDEAWDNQMNMALAHVLGATIQTSLFNGPLVVLVGWALNKPMGLNFDLFNIIVLIFAILVVGNFLRDQKSNYLEGTLCVIIYVAIAMASLYYPNPPIGPKQPNVGQGTTQAGPARKFRLS